MCSHVCVCVCRLTSHVWDLHEHSGDEVDALQQLQVDVHVVGLLAAFLDLLLFGRSLVLALQQEALGEQLLGAPRALDVHKAVVGVLDHPLSEGTQTELHHGAVIQDLQCNEIFVRVRKRKAGVQCWQFQ